MLKQIIKLVAVIFLLGVSASGFSADILVGNLNQGANAVKIVSVGTAILPLTTINGVTASASAQVRVILQVPTAYQTTNLTTKCQMTTTPINFGTAPTGFKYYVATRLVNDNGTTTIASSVTKPTVPDIYSLAVSAELSGKDVMVYMDDVTCNLDSFYIL